MAIPERISNLLLAVMGEVVSEVSLFSPAAFPLSQLTAVDSDAARPVKGTLRECPSMYLSCGIYDAVDLGDLFSGCSIPPQLSAVPPA
jgi:hypothetical protein